MKKKEIISQLERDLNKAHKRGHITSIQHLPQKKGLELSLPATVDMMQAQTIASFIQKKYNLQTYFFAKKHNIVVYYEN